MVIRFSGALPGNSVAVVRSAAQTAVQGSPPEPGQGPGVLASEHPAARDLAPVLASALRAHPDFDPSLYPAALSFPAFYRYRVSTSSATQLAQPLAGTNPRMRVDISVLLWLSEKTAYDGGGVLIDDGGAVTRWTGEPGDAIAYSARARRAIEPITRGELLVCLLEVQSLVGGESERGILFDFNRALQEFERRPSSAQHAQTMRRVYNGLVRMWADFPRRASAP